MSIPDLTPTRLARIREIFDEALELEGAEREAYLARSCANDDGLRREVDDFLSALARGDEKWERPIADITPGAPRSEPIPIALGQRIGAYEITRLIGYGGMGAVYEAVRADDQYRKRVAIKFLRQGVEGETALRRFRRERQILANLNHRNITALLDGGVMVDGQPYIVMEYIAGDSITEYCLQRKLPVRDRVMLFQQVCAAVQHAHQNLVVHRDLKPGNILVTEDGAVKLLDFGIAGLLRDIEGAESMPATQGVLRAYTPEYASPEQVRAQPVATASDIYSLGVIACEVLTGKRPFRFEHMLLAEIQATICFGEPKLPSQLVDGVDPGVFGERNVRRVRSQLAGDIDAIAALALQKEPEHRYGSVEQMNLDLQRHLDGLPVSARRDSLRYRAAKFIRRRRVESAAVALVVISLVGGIVSSTRLAAKAQQERSVAVRERAKMEQVNTFLSNMLSAADPASAGRDVTVAQVLAAAARDIDSQALDPEIEAQVRHTIAQTYYGLGLYEEATVHAERAFAIRQRVFGELDLRTTASLSYVAAMAEARGDYAVAESISRKHVDLQRRMPVVEPTELATALDNLARAIEHQGRLDEAMPIKLESLELRRQRSDSAARAALSFTLNNLSVSYQYQGNFAKAESLAREALDVEADVHGKRSFNYGSLLRNYASIQDELGKVPQADSIIRESMAVMRAVAGPSHTEYLRSVNMYAQLRYTAGDMPNAIEASREVVASVGRSLHESEPASATAYQVLGLALDSLRQFAAADSALRRSLELRQKYLGADHWAVASSESVLGYHLGRVGKFAEAERLMTRAYAKLVETRGAGASVTKRVAIRIAELFEQQKRVVEAKRWRELGN